MGCLEFRLAWMAYDISEFSDTLATATVVELPWLVLSLQYEYAEDVRDG